MRTFRPSTNSSLSPYRKVLVDKKAEILGALGSDGQRLTGPEWETPEEQILASNDQYVRLQVNEALHNQFHQVEEALVRLERGEYGICLRCGSPISANRLRLIPWTRCCVSCQEQEDAACRNTDECAAKGELRC
jgi:DnaK suppressor protein